LTYLPDIIDIQYDGIFIGQSVRTFSCKLPVILVRV